MLSSVILPVADSAGTLPKPCNAGFVDMGWVTEDLIKNEAQQGL
jgi:hypothetical protein